MSWLETYRGTVYRWEVDNVDHFTVAYYFERFEDATLALLHALGLDPEALAETGEACAMLDSHVRYLRELRMGDILHIRSGVIDTAGDALMIGHQVFDSADGALCTSVAQRMGLMQARSRTPVRLPAASLEAAESYRVDWEPRPVPVPAPPRHADADRFLETTRDTIKPREVDVLGQAALAAYIHRFSAANGHMLAGFGMSPAYMRSEERGLSTFEFKLRVPGALRAGDLVRVRSALSHVGASSLRLLHRMTNVRTDEEVATLEQSGVHLDTRARRSCPLPDSMRERAMARLLVPDADTKRS
ncbi:MAG TPA: thioesterase family protein [Candidatus Methylomirabilis sp.]|nr:thioesterase family protein [Candidatus Methylomirabilis sp.]